MLTVQSEKRLSQKVGKLKSIIRLRREYLEICLEDEDKRNQKLFAEAESKIMRDYAERYFDYLNKEQVKQTVAHSILSKESEAYFSMRREIFLSGKALTEREDAELESEFRHRLAEKYVRISQAAEAYPFKTPTEESKTAFSEAKANLNSVCEKITETANLRKAKFSDREERQIAKLTVKLVKSEEKMNRLQSRCELPEGICLSVRGLRMYFGGVKAVDGLDFDVSEGEILGLIGPNGAGKTTVFNCITQFCKPTAGSIIFRDRENRVTELTREKVHNVILRGIARTFQNVELVPELTVLENLLAAGHRQFFSGIIGGALHLPCLKKEERVMRRRAEEILNFTGLAAYKDRYAFGLPYGIMKKIEIARTLINSPKLIILDEPAAGLNDVETMELAGLIRKIRDKYHCSVLLVEHDMGLVMDVCDKICAISFGKLLAYGTPQQIRDNPNVQTAYLGTEEDE